MKIKKLSDKDMLRLKKFLRSKKILIKDLSKEMEYSIEHIIKVLNCKRSYSRKFIGKLFFAITIILQRDLKEFHGLLGELSWITF